MTTPTQPTFNFPHPVLTPLPVGKKPDYFYLRQLRIEVYANATSVPSALGGGNHGHLGEVINPAAYTMLSLGFNYVAPVNPGNHPVYPPGADAAQMAGLDRQWQRETIEFQTAQNVRNAIRGQLLLAVPETYLKPIKHRILGFGQVNPATIMDHLMLNYGQMTHEDHAINRATMETKWDPSTPLSELWALFQDAQDIAFEGGIPISDTDCMNTALKLLEKTGLYEHAISTWRINNLIWVYNAFQNHFNLAEKERLRKTTASSAGYTANAAAEVAPKQEKKEQPIPPGTKLTDHMVYCWSHGLG